MALKKNSRFSSYAGLIAICILAVVVRCVNLRQGLWWDEIWSTVEYATASSWWYSISRLGFYFNNHPLYTILGRISIAVFGLSEISLRLPAVLMGTAAVPVLYAMARPMTGTIPALLASFLLSISAFHIDHSTEARGYAGLMLFALLASSLFFNVLKSGLKRAWAGFVVCTFLGFYCHAYMAQVPFVQLTCCMLFAAEQALLRGRVRYMYKGALPHLVLALAVAACVTLVAYAPMLRFFIANAGKVQFLSVDRLPFVAEMYETVLPGFTTVPGMLLYSVLSLCGLLYLRKRSVVLFLYTIVMSNVPLLLYLQLNPMFIFKRYFLPALPFCLLTLACGMVWIARALRLKGHVRGAFYGCMLSAIVYLQWPAIVSIATENRQHYREAADFVESRASGMDSIVFAIGHAGAHFRYYAQFPVVVPETFAEFTAALDSGAQVWCLISAWLPELRPAHEPALLYMEDPQHQLIYDYVRANFQQAVNFRAIFPTYVYCRRVRPAQESMHR